MACEPAREGEYRVRRLSGRFQPVRQRNGRVTAMASGGIGASLLYGDGVNQPGSRSESGRGLRSPVTTFTTDLH